MIQYVRECLAKEKPAQFSIRYLRELLPETQDEFIRPVFSGESTEVSVNCTQLLCIFEFNMHIFIMYIYYYICTYAIFVVKYVFPLFLA